MEFEKEYKKSRAILVLLEGIDSPKQQQILSNMKKRGHFYV